VKAYRDQVGEMAAFWDLGMIGAQKRWDGLEGPTGLSCTVCFLVFSIVNHLIIHACRLCWKQGLRNRVTLPRVTDQQKELVAADVQCPLAVEK
jgi:hypothetical protein